MAWFRRTRVTQVRDPRPARFLGFADETPDLCDFTTAAGEHVVLYDAYLECVRYEVGAPPGITLTFVVSRDRSSADASGLQHGAGTRVTFQFSDAYIILWESSQEMPSYRCDRTVPHGQVHEFSFYASRCFAIETIDDAIYVEASSIEVALQPISAEDLESVLGRVAGA